MAGMLKSLVFFGVIAVVLSYSVFALTLLTAAVAPRHRDHPLGDARGPARVAKPSMISMAFDAVRQVLENLENSATKEMNPIRCLGHRSE